MAGAFFSIRTCLLALAAVTVIEARADTIFSDTFNSGSTLNTSPTTNISGSATSYQTAIGTISGYSSIAPNALKLTLPNSSTVLGEMAGLFTNSPLPMNSAGDYVAIAVIFTNTQNILSGNDSSGATLNVGLFNSGGVPPNQGNIVLSTGTTTGGAQNWVGYASRIFLSGNATIFTRSAQTPNGTSSQNQDLLFSGVSSSQSFNSPQGTSLGSTASAVTLSAGAVYTLYLSVMLAGGPAYIITNTLYSGAGTGGTAVFTQTKTATGTNVLSAGFNGFAFGWRNSSSAAQISIMTVSSITITGYSTPPYVPPIITSQPVPVSVSIGNSCAFAVGVTPVFPPPTYQWHRNGTNLLDGGNISGSTSSQLVISPATSADVASGANGYYVTVNLIGGFTANYVTNPLTLVAPRNLLWSGTGDTWDLNTSSNWLNAGAPSAFTFGDAVTFDDTGSAYSAVNLASVPIGYLSASTLTVSAASTVYSFSGSGSFAGLGTLVLTGPTEVIIANTNTYTGGTLISNSMAHLDLKSYGGLGTGPLTLVGGTVEIEPSGTTQIGLPGNIVVDDDGTIQLDATGNFAGVFLGNLSGLPGKTLTLTPSASAMTNANRYRIYGTNTVMNANIVINSTTTQDAKDAGTVIAPYGFNGSQTYNGIISGNGGIVQRGFCVTYLNGPNTYSGGTFLTTGTVGLGSDDPGGVGSLGTGALWLAPETPNLTGSGTVFASGGSRTIANEILYPSGTNNLTLVIGGTNNLNFTGPIMLNGQDGNLTSTITARIFQVTNSAATVFTGLVSDSGFGYGLTKTGSGTLYLAATNTYAGATIISAGVLALSGSGLLAATPMFTIAPGATLDANGRNDQTLTLNSGQTLTGGGFIGGNLTASAGSTIAPGYPDTNSIATLSVQGNIKLAGTVVLKLNRTNAAACDQLLTSGTTGAGGTLVVTNLGPDLQLGDTFHLFSNVTNSFAVLTLPSLPPNLDWTDRLDIDGTIRVTSSDITFPRLTTTVTPTNIAVSWPFDRLGWHLQSTTNLDPAVWQDVPGTDSTNAYVTPMDPAAPPIYFRLTLP